MRVVIIDNEIQLTGKIHLEEVMEHYRLGLAAMQQQEHLILNLQKIESGNTAMLTLLLAWLGAARKQHKKLTFKHVPEFLFLTSRVYGIEKLLLIGYHN